MAAILLLPAYGRYYSSEKDMVKDWQNGVDFKVLNGPYCSIRDLDTMKRMYWAEDIVLCDMQFRVNHTVSRGLGV